MLCLSKRILLQMMENFADTCERCQWHHNTCITSMTVCPPFELACSQATVYLLHAIIVSHMLHFQTLNILTQMVNCLLKILNFNIYRLILQSKQYDPNYISRLTLKLYYHALL